MDIINLGKDSEYGKVCDLFDRLNYESERVGTARPYSVLARKTVNHRKHFVQTVLNARPNPRPFSIKFDDPDVQLCASTFLEENKSEFRALSIHVHPSKLSYNPNSDNAELIDVLAKIFCHQELSHLKNQQQSQNNKNPVTGDIDGEDDYDQKDGEPRASRPKKKAKSKSWIHDDESLTDGDEALADHNDVQWSPGASARREAEPPVDKYLRHNTKIHLDVCYPPAGTVEATDGTWLLVSGSTWPEDFWPFTFRFIHEHQAYKLPQTNHVRNFFTVVKQQLRLPADMTEEQNEKVLRKCGNFMSSWVQKWITFGLLVQNGDDILRHSYLESMLLRYRTRWIATVYQGRTTAPELQKPALPVSKSSVQKRSAPARFDEAGQNFEASMAKKAKFNPESSHGYNNHAETSMDGLQERQHHGAAELPVISRGGSSNNPQYGRPASKSKTSTPVRESSVELPYGRTFSSFPDSQDSSVPLRPGATDSNTTKNPSQSGEEPAAAASKGPRPWWAKTQPSMSEVTSPSHPISEVPDARVTGASIPPVPHASMSSPKAQRIPVAQSGYSTTGQPQARPSAGELQSEVPQSPVNPSRHQTKSTSNLRLEEAFDSQIPDFVRRISAPYSISGAELPRVEGDIKSVASSAMPNTSHQSPKPSVSILKLIIEQAEGDMNFENPMLEADLRSGSVADFFERVRSRRTNPNGHIRTLKFKQRWGANKIYVVDRETSEETWKKTRNEIRRNFEALKDKKPDRKKFEVDVLVEGDEVDGDDDDGDDDYE